MAVPNTNTFKLTDVTSEIGLSSTASLQDCFDNAIDGGFDPAYSGSKDRQSNFRNYNHVSPPSYDWVIRSAAQSNDWQDVCFADGHFIALSNDGSQRKMYSTNGTSWTGVTIDTESWYKTAGNSTHVYGIISGSNNRFGRDTYNGSMTLYSELPSSSWSTISRIGSDGSGNFMIASGVVTERIDGVVATAVSNPLSSGSLRCSTTDGTSGNVVLLGFGVGIRTENSGLSWTTLSVPSQSVEGLAYGNGVYVGVGTNGAVRSTNGTNFTSVSVPNGLWKSVAFGAGIFVACEGSSSADVIISEDNGLTWTQYDTNLGQACNGIAFNNNRFVVVGNNGAVATMDV